MSRIILIHINMNLKYLTMFLNIIPLVHKNRKAFIKSNDLCCFLSFREEKSFSKLTWVAGKAVAIIAIGFIIEGCNFTTLTFSFSVVSILIICLKVSQNLI